MNGDKNLPIEPVDYKQAIYWNQRAADNGEAEGFNNLGWLYENGLGTQQDLVKAAEFYQNAITLGIKNDNVKENIKEAQDRLKAIKSRIKI